MVFWGEWGVAYSFSGYFDNCVWSRFSLPISFSFCLPGCVEEKKDVLKAFIICTRYLQTIDLSD
jgi:hypothetical protein